MHREDNRRIFVKCTFERSRDPNERRENNTIEMVMGGMVYEDVNWTHLVLSFLHKFEMIVINVC
jgi:hypothetical protein